MMLVDGIEDKGNKRETNNTKKANKLGKETKN